MKERKIYRAVIESIEMRIMVQSQFCLGLTAVAYRRETWNVVFIQ